MKAREIAKRYAFDHGLKEPMDDETLEPYMDGEKVTPKRLEKANDALDALRDSMTKRWKLDGAAPKKKKKKA